MRDEAGAPAGQTAQIGTGQAARLLQGFVAQYKPLVGVDLTGKKAFGRAVEADQVIQLAFSQLCPAAVRLFAHIGQQPGLLADRLDMQGPALVGANAIPSGEGDPCQRCALFGVGAGLASGQEHHGHRAVLHGKHRAETHLQFSVADPALARKEIVHRSTSVW